MTEWYSVPETTGGSDAEASELIGRAIMAAIGLPAGVTDVEAVKAIRVAIAA
jgi:hypothetical protein